MDSALARLLRDVRSRSGLSQLELSFRLGVSQRHVSFVERAHARPGRALLLAWMREAGANGSLRNAALMLAGFAPQAPAPALPGAAAAGRDALTLWAIELHEPNPALVFDTDWQIVRMNAAARWLSALVMPDVGRGGERMDMLAVLAHPAGWLARAREPVAIAAALIGQLRAEQWLRPSLAPRVDALVRTLEQRYGALPAEPARDPAATGFDLALDTPLGCLNFCSIQASIGLPQDAAAGGLRTELWYPADEQTCQVMRCQAATPHRSRSADHAARPPAGRRLDLLRHVHPQARQVGKAEAALTEGFVVRVKEQGFIRDKPQGSCSGPTSTACLPPSPAKESPR
jgi:transcriptional regulator with XRE-family HTH domain